MRWAHVVLSVLSAIRWRFWSFLATGCALIFFGMLAKQTQSALPAHLIPLMCDLLVQVGMAVVGAVVIGSLIDVYLESKREENTLARFLRQVFNSASNLPIDDLYRIVQYFLEIEWIRGDIEVDISLTLVPENAELIQAETKLHYPIRCIAIDSPGSPKRRSFYTRQRLSPLGLDPKFQGAVEAIEIKGDDVSTSLKEVDSAILERYCLTIGRYRCFDYELVGQPGSTRDFTLGSKRFLKDGDDDWWDSRVPAKSITVRVTFNPKEIRVEALRLEPKNSPGRWSTNVYLTPKPGESKRLEDGSMKLVFECRPVLPLEGMIIRAHRIKDKESGDA